MLFARYETDKSQQHSVFLLSHSIWIKYQSPSRNSGQCWPLTLSSAFILKKFMSKLVKPHNMNAFLEFGPHKHTKINIQAYTDFI